MKSKLFVLLIVLLSLNCGYYNAFTAYYNTFYNAKHEYEAGVEEVLKNQGKPLNSSQAKHFKDAIDKCWRIIEFHGYENAWADDAILLIAKCEFYLNKIESARQHIKLFREKFPNSPLLYHTNFFEAKCYLADKDTLTALNMLEKNILIAKDKKLRSDIFLQQARIYFDQKKYDESVIHYEKALKEASDKLQKANIQFYLAESYFSSNQWEEARAGYKKVMKFTPTLQVEFLTQYHYAVCIFKLGKSQKAIEFLERMLTASRFKPYYPEIFTQLGDIYRELKDFESMRFYYREGIKQRTGQGRDHANFAMALAFEDIYHHVDSAVFYYKEAQKLGRNTEFGKMAEEKAAYLNKLAQIKDKVDYERILIYRLQNDPAFRDSLEDARRMQKMFDKNKNRTLLPVKQLLFKLAKKDTQQVFFTPSLFRLSEKLKYDSLRFMKKIDSLEQDFKKDTLVFLDTIKYPPKDTIATIYFDYKKNEGLFKKTKKHQVESRTIEEAQEDLKKHLLELADFYLFETSQVDSARKLYGEFISSYKDTTLLPRALFAMAFIKKNHDKDMQGYQKLINVLLSQYPESLYAKRYREQSNGNQRVSKWKTHYEQAQNYLFNGKPDSGLVIFEDIYQKSDSLSEFKPKSLFAIAWTFEHLLHQPDSAIFFYEMLKNKYKDTPYGKKAITKLQIETLEAKPDTVQIALKSDKKTSSNQMTQESPYSEEDIKRIKDRINQIIRQDYLSETRAGEMRRYWAKTQLRNFLNNL